MKNLLTTIIVLSICNASDAIAEDWPVNPTTTQHSVVGTIGEFLAEVTRTWQAVAAEVGAKRAEVTRMVSAFEHEDLQAALKLSG